MPFAKKAPAAKKAAPLKKAAPPKKPASKKGKKNIENGIPPPQKTVSKHGGAPPRYKS